ncbi:hypothetical protein NEIFLAOT_02122 [Neisseria flavescens NRL30031/H210]|uniref:Uncharacterized protein n=1 Tax=Neisseria flavescens NRL30031/H210 TaxID=546264 RepID=C0EQ80_NEIFL|nr:hypothetical protein NEIFLAOT_02122 [Neisseria flavescens NRL30031/H210]
MWASLTKTGNPIPFAIISANVIHRQSSRYGSIQKNTLLSDGLPI